MVHYLDLRNAGTLTQLQQLLKERRSKLFGGFTTDEVAALCNTSSGGLHRYLNEKDRIKTFTKLLELCNGLALNVSLRLGSSGTNAPVYAVRYTGDMHAFKVGLGRAVAAARKASGVTQRQKHAVHEAGQAQLGRLERAEGDTPKIETISGIFRTLGAILVVQIETF